MQCIEAKKKIYENRKVVASGNLLHLFINGWVRVRGAVRNASVPYHHGYKWSTFGTHCAMDRINDSSVVKCHLQNLNKEENISIFSMIAQPEHTKFP
jgi:hypothetical protein